MENSLRHIYFMPGMAANKDIFEHIRLPEDRFMMHFLEWKIPLRGESVSAYAKRMCEEVHHERPVLLGVSFGGIIIQEMAKHIAVEKLIVVSSVKSKYELPRRMRYSALTGVHKLLPAGVVRNVEVLAQYAFGEAVKKRLSLYEKYLSVRDPYYIRWSVDKIVNWDQEAPLQNTIHIQGEKDPVFPIKNIRDCILVKGATHIAIISRYTWFNSHLPELIEGS
ncbi:alpha/beta fold hydrolase [Robertkochia solimangrovi]|uniref:alpha/beta fold hydrolase n=1 Tax=Robertkochia solimangrovi TaxID=2213046 RepID=UPI00117C68C7|nr:alpha/beta hydrolase [Robertkochia solimangrovi]TRZ43675.1 alpha/beta hydrolase [Robertkochia solimangrovi]